MGGLENYVCQVLGGLDARHELTLHTITGQARRIRDFAPRARMEVVDDALAGVSIEKSLDPAPPDVLFSPLAFLDPIVPPLPCAVELNDLAHEFRPGDFTPEALAFRRDRYRSAAW